MYFRLATPTIAALMAVSGSFLAGSLVSGCSHSGSAEPSPHSGTAERVHSAAPEEAELPGELRLDRTSIPEREASRGTTATADEPLSDSASRRQDPILHRPADPARAPSPSVQAPSVQAPSIEAPSIEAPSTESPSARSEPESLAIAALTPTSRAALRRAPDPMLVLPASYAAASVVTSGANWGAQSYRDSELAISIHAVAESRNLLSPEELAQIPPPRDQIRDLPARISQNEQIRTASWMEESVSFSLEVECAHPMDDRRCTENQFIRELAGQLVRVTRSVR